MADIENPPPGATGDGAGLDVEQHVYARPRAEAQYSSLLEFNEPSALKPPRRRATGDEMENRSTQSQGLGAAGIIVRLMRECEGLRDENAELRIALSGFDIEPQSPFPLLSGDEILRILHPEGARPAPKDKFSAGAEAKRAIARVTHQLAGQSRPASEIKAAVLAEAERGGLSSKDALAISANIIREKVEEVGHA